MFLALYSRFVYLVMADLTLAETGRVGLLATTLPFCAVARALSRVLVGEVIQNV